MKNIIINAKFIATPHLCQAIYYKITGQIRGIPSANQIADYFDSWFGAIQKNMIDLENEYELAKEKQEEAEKMN